MILSQPESVLSAYKPSVMFAYFYQPHHCARETSGVS
jgi:hypothetical protein